MCQGVDRIFHWEGGTSVRNSSGDNRIVNFYEQWPWNMAMLEMFLGGRARYRTYNLMPARAVQASTASMLNGTITVIESVLPSGEYMALVAALGATRQSPFRTSFPLVTDAAALLDISASAGGLDVRQWRMNSSRSVVETIVRELSDKHDDQYLQHNDSLPYDVGRLLTPAGLAYVEAPENLERYWRMQEQTFEPAPFEGRWQQDMVATETTFHLDLVAPSVTVISARRVGAADPR
jgi:hypothetical protein